MYAVVKTLGHQFTVQESDRLTINRLEGEVGSAIQLDQVLLIGGDSSKIGTPYVVGAKVEAKILAHRQGKKIHGFNYKAKKNIRKRWGHRQKLTDILITKIHPGK